MKTQLAELTVLETQLAKAKTLEEVKNVAKQADVVAIAARRMGAKRTVVDQAMWIFLLAYRQMGELLGERPGKGPGAGNKGNSDVTFIPKMQAHRCRRLAWDVSYETCLEYKAWVEKQDKVPYLRLQDILVLTRLGDLQRPVMECLTSGGAETIQEAVRVVRRVDIEESVSDVPKGEYQCIVVDPPWPMQKVERELHPRQGDVEYKLMTLEDIAQISIPASENAHLYLWTTQRFLPDAFGILGGWGFRYVFTMVWHKSGGFQPVELPQYNCEFVLFGRRGVLPFLDTKNFNCCFDGKRRAHSRKPDEFYDLVRRVSVGPRIDMFSRESREEFDSWGNEAGRFDG